MDYHKCIAFSSMWVKVKTAKDSMNWATLCLKNIFTPKIGIESVSITKYISAMALNTSLGLFESRACAIVKTESKKYISLLKYTKNATIVGQLLGTISNLTFTSLSYQGIQMAK